MARDLAERTLILRVPLGAAPTGRAAAKLAGASRRWVCAWAIWRAPFGAALLFPRAAVV